MNCKFLKLKSHIQVGFDFLNNYLIFKKEKLRRFGGEGGGGCSVVKWKHI